MEKIKQFIENDKGKDILVIIIIILVGLGSFELGRLSKNEVISGIKVEYGTQEASVIGSVDLNNNNSLNLNPNSNTLTNTQKLNSENFFASSRGSKYYSISCGAGKTIKQENRIYFKTGEEAQNAGYQLSNACR